MSDVKKKNPLFELFMQLVMVIVIYTVRVYLLVWYRPKVTFLGETVKSPRLKTHDARNLFSSQKHRGGERPD